jgi:hypothetical protein
MFVLHWIEARLMLREGGRKKLARLNDAQTGKGAFAAKPASFKWLAPHPRSGPKPAFKSHAHAGGTGMRRRRASQR